tara:strand:+ start:1496 stop:1864 length:369 start_codon:yes stop_codon:yes gene_type:complete
MARYNYFDKGDHYSEFHRQFDGLAMIDIDAIEICKKCKSPLAVIETAYDKGQNFKSFIVTQLVAKSLKVPGLVTLYQVDPKSKEIVNFRVKKIFPNESDKFYPIQPYKFVSWLKGLHEQHKC